LPPANATEAEIRDWCAAYLKTLVDDPSVEVDPEASFAQMGIDSAKSIHFVVELEEWLGLELNPEIVGDYPTFGELARHLAQVLSQR